MHDERKGDVAPERVLSGLVLEGIAEHAASLTGDAQRGRAFSAQGPGERPRLGAISVAEQREEVEALALVAERDRAFADVHFTFGALERPRTGPAHRSLGCRLVDLDVCDRREDASRKRQFRAREGVGEALILGVLVRHGSVAPSGDVG